MNATTKIEFDCPSCGKAFSVGAHLAGKTAKCLACGNKFVVPEPAVNDPFPDLGEFVGDMGSAAPLENDPLADFDAFGAATSANAFPDQITDAHADPFADLGSLGSTPTGSELPQKQCPECMAPMAAGAVLCVKCGFDLRIGKQRQQEAVKDRVNFPQSKASRILAMSVAVVLIVAGIDLADREQLIFDAGTLVGVLIYFALICLFVLFAWRYEVSIEVSRAPGKPAQLYIRTWLGPFPFVTTWDLSKFDSVWFVQEPWGTARQIRSLIRTICSFGIYWLIRKLSGFPEQINYRAELRNRERKVVIYAGNELVKDDVNAIVQMIRNTGGLPLKNDLKMLK